MAAFFSKQSQDASKWFFFFLFKDEFDQQGNVNTKHFVSERIKSETSL